MDQRTARTRAFLIALLGGSGVLHFLRPAPFVAMVPRALPRKRDLVYLSGAAELLSAGLLAVPRTRRWGGTAAAAVLVAVFPANVSMALHSGNRPAWYRIAVWARLPLQAPLIGWARAAGR